MPPTAAILISRQPIRPCGRTPWVQSLKAAMEYIADEGWTLTTSTGLLPWDLQAALAASLRIPAVIVLPPADPSETEREAARIMRDFDLEHKIVKFRHLRIADGDATRHNLMQARDSEVVSSADILLPIAVREGGTMARLLAEGRAAGKRVIDDFSLSTPTERIKHAYRIDPDELDPDLDETNDAFLIHFTRASNGPWPTENRSEFCRALLDSDRYPRGALDTLRNIVTTRRLIASANHMPCRIATVSFTALSPREVAPLIRWRARYSRMSFEPYGIGINRQTAVERGVVPVVYTGPSEKRPADDSQIWRYQSVGNKTDWRQENEYRCRGDFDLSGIPRDRLRLFCRCRSEARELEQATGIRAFAFTKV